ncbi:MAG: hypothetical protein DID92_2727745126 [Candidatus Nitrotoga sp. SPKER]|nr:MAG: hypothetical protein DID92_2727745126 [Candidatus Nitrotoga sp. SPKER]
MIDALTALEKRKVLCYCCTSCINAGTFRPLSTALAALLYRITIYPLHLVGIWFAVRTKLKKVEI